MTGYFSLWDTRGRNIIDTYSTAAVALRSAADLLQSFGMEYADDLELSWTSHDQSQHQVIGTGPALVALASGVLDGHQTLPEFVAARRARRAPARHRRRHVIREVLREPVAS